MTLGELLAVIASLLDEAGVQYMVTGSTASSLYGAPRATRDLDLVIDPTPSSLRRFIDGLPRSRFYVDPEAAAEALRSRGQFNLIEHGTGWKVDLIVRRDRPFSVSEIRRRRPQTLLGTRASVATAEDVVIAKLEWARAGDSERQLRDCAAILDTQGDALDRHYIERWVRALGLEEGWETVQDG